MQEQNPFVTITSEEIQVGRFTVIEDEVWVNGQKRPYDYIKMREGVCILPIHKNKVVALREYRYPIRSWQTELPGGLIDDGEDAMTAAKRELQEETGYVAEEMIDLGVFYPSFGSTNEKIHVFAAVCKEQKESSLDAAEVLKIKEVPVNTFAKMIASGEIMHAAGIVAWARYQEQKRQEPKKEQENIVGDEKEE